MRMTRISQGGQIQIPAEVRKRWGTREVIVEDGGSYLRIRPVPNDPIGAAGGMFARSGGRSAAEEVRSWREEDLAAEEAKWARAAGDRDRP